MWFTVSLFYRGKHDDLHAQEEMWEESIVLVDAMDEKQAVLQAMKLAQESFDYKTDDGHVCWIFDSINKVFTVEFDDLTNGIEIFSRYLRYSEVASLKKPFDT